VFSVSWPRASAIGVLKAAIEFVARLFVLAQSHGAIANRADRDLQGVAVGVSDGDLEAFQESRDSSVPITLGGGPVDAAALSQWSEAALKYGAEHQAHGVLAAIPYSDAPGTQRGVDADTAGAVWGMALPIERSSVSKSVAGTSIYLVPSPIIGLFQLTAYIHGHVVAGDDSAA